jgi:hypothetical protein
MLKPSTLTETARSKFRVILEKLREQVTVGRAIGKEEILKRLKK